MNIKLDWNDPASISPNAEQDVIVMHFRNHTEATFSPEVGKMLH